MASGEPQKCCEEEGRDQFSEPPDHYVAAYGLIADSTVKSYPQDVQFCF
jgi:hypothetical protein